MIKTPNKNHFYVISPCDENSQKMSGTRTIKAEEIKLLADFPIVGPVDGDELISQSATFKLGTGPYVVRTVSTGGQVVNAGAQVPVVMSNLSINGPTFPADEHPSCYNFPTASLDGPNGRITFVTNSAKGTASIRLGLSTNLAAAPAAPPEPKFNILFTISTNIIPGYVTHRTQQTVVSYNNTVSSYSVSIPFSVPYVSTTTSISVTFVIQNLSLNPLTLDSSTQAEVYLF